MKQHVTGSIMEEFLRELVDQTWFEEDLKKSCNPVYMYQEEGKGPGDTVWLYSTGRKTYVPLRLHFKIEPLEEILQPDSIDGVLCMIGHEIFMVPAENLKDVGYN